MSIKDERTYHEDGKLMRITNLKDGIKDGLEKIYYQNGKLEIKRTYKDGKLEGPLESY